MGKFTVALGWPSVIDKVENCHTWVHRWVLQANYFPKKKLTNNLADTVLDLFRAVQKDENLWPSRKRVEKGVEKVLVCDAMVQARGDNRGSFIAGPSSRSTSFSS